MHSSQHDNIDIHSRSVQENKTIRELSAKLGLWHDGTTGQILIAIMQKLIELQEGMK